MKLYLVTWGDPENDGYYAKLEPKDVPRLMKKLSFLGDDLEFQDISAMALTEINLVNTLRDTYE